MCRRGWLSLIGGERAGRREQLHVAGDHAAEPPDRPGQRRRHPFGGIERAAQLWHLLAASPPPTTPPPQQIHHCFVDVLLLLFVSGVDVCFYLWCGMELISFE